VAHACHPNYKQNVNRRTEVWVGPGTKMRFYSKNNKSKKGRGVAQVVKYQPGKCKATKRPIQI
jgi:aspartyl aminopeptidase